LTLPEAVAALYLNVFSSHDNVDAFVVRLQYFMDATMNLVVAQAEAEAVQPPSGTAEAKIHQISYMWRLVHRTRSYVSTT
jgi:hypothetical protein